jgi:hypothetical protein
MNQIMLELQVVINEHLVYQVRTFMLMYPN